MEEAYRPTCPLHVPGAIVSAVPVPNAFKDQFTVAVLEDKQTTLRTGSLYHFVYSEPDQRIKVCLRVQQTTNFIQRFILNHGPSMPGVRHLEVNLESR